MSGDHVATARRNASVLGLTTVAVGGLLLYPTSTNHGGSHRTPGQPVASAGVVAAPPPSPGASPTPGAGSGSSGSGSGGAGSGAGGAGSGGATAPGVTGPLVVNGTSVQTRYGPVQVQIHVAAGKISAVHAIDYPQGSGRDQEINSIALPILDQETLTAQSATIDTVSGATYTSLGYQRSLQAALDAAHLH